MDNTELHYVTYDSEEIWKDVVTAYVEAGGDILYPGDEKEMLLRSVQSVVTQLFAAVDNALRMQTLRYALGEYLDVLGEQRNCLRILATAAKATFTFTFNASGQSKVIRTGTAMTADGELFYTTINEFTQTGYAQVITVEAVCSQKGSAGNGLLSGTQMQLAITNPAVVSVFAAISAAGGNDEEDDKTYRERIRLYGLASVTTGPSGQYESKAKNVSSEILDAKAVNMSAGSVGVYLILESSTGAAAILQSVRDALNATNVRPLTDTVTVGESEIVPYTLNVQYSADTGSNITAAIAAAIAEYEKWQDNVIGRAFNPDHLMASIYQAGATRVLWGVGSNFNNGKVEYTAIAVTKHCKGTITLAVITP